MSASEHIYNNIASPHSTRHISAGHDKYKKSISSICFPFVPNECKGMGSKTTYTSPYGGHQVVMNNDHPSQMMGHWTTDAAAASSTIPSVRNEYNLFGFQDHGFGPEPGSATIAANGPLFACYPTFHGKGYFNKTNNCHGFGWSMVDTKGGYPGDVAGVSFNVINFGGGNNIKVRDSSGNFEEVSVGNDSYQVDWQFNLFWGIYRAKQGHYFSIPFLPNGDNYGNTKANMNASTGAYVFRNSNDSTDRGTDSFGSDSFWSKGGYKKPQKKFRMTLLTDSNTATPKNALFCGIEFSTWWGTEGSASKSRTFQINELSVIPDAVAKEIRGKGPIAIPSRFNNVYPKYMSFNDMEGGDRWELNKFQANYKGNTSSLH